MLLSLLLSNPIEFLIIAGLLITAISFHEFAHAFVADRLGDPTPKLMGRLTVNPLAHLDPIGSLLMLVTGWGWGKPVPYDPFNLRNPIRDAALISFAGPGSNLVMAIIASILLRIIISVGTGGPLGIIYEIVNLFIYFNVLLALFNLIPIHPLDGFKIVAGFLPRKYYEDWMSLSPYGMIFLLLLIFPLFGGSSPISTFLTPVVNFIVSLLTPGRGGIV